MDMVGREPFARMMERVAARSLELHDPVQTKQPFPKRPALKRSLLP